MASGSLWLAVLVALTCIGDKILCDKVCDRGWTYSELDHSCLRFYQTDRKSFGGARRVCQKSGGDLVSVRYKKKNEYLRNLILVSSSMFWIGVQDKKKTREFTHLDGSGLGFQPWSYGKPRYHRKSNKESCVIAYIPQRGKTVWRNEKCSGKRPYMCQKDANGHNPYLNSNSARPFTGNEGSWCPKDWLLYEDDKSCLRNYRLPFDFKTFQEARTVCQEDGADFVRVKDLKKDKFILDMDWSYVNVPAFWVKEEKDLAKDFNPWSPRSSVKRAAGLCLLSEYIPSMDLHSKWRYQQCDKRQYFVCEKPAQ